MTMYQRAECKRKMGASYCVVKYPFVGALRTWYYQRTAMVKIDDIALFSAQNRADFSYSK